MTTSDSVENRSAVSRRTVVKGAAWSVPVVMVAAAAPALAASPTERAPIYFTDFGTGCVITDSNYARWWGEPHRQEIWVRIVNEPGGFGGVKIDQVTLGGVVLNLREAFASSGGALTISGSWLVVSSQWVRLVFSSTAPLGNGLMTINYHWGSYPADPYQASSSAQVAFSLTTCPPPLPQA